MSGKTLREKRFAHPDVGEVTLTMQAFDVRSGHGQELVVHHAEPGSRSAQALALLGSRAASESDEISEQRRLQVRDHRG